MGNLFCCCHPDDKKTKSTSVKTLLRRAEKPSRRRKRIDDLVADFLKREEREEKYERRKNLKAKQEGPSKDTFCRTTTRDVENIVTTDLSGSSGAVKINHEYKEEDVDVIKGTHMEIDSTGSLAENCDDLLTTKAQESELSRNLSDGFLFQNQIVDEVRSYASSDYQTDTENSSPNGKPECLEIFDCLEKGNLIIDKSETVPIEHSISELKDGCPAINADISGLTDVHENVGAIPDESRVMSDTTNNDFTTDEMESDVNHTNDNDRTSDSDCKTDMDICGEEPNRKDGYSHNDSPVDVVDDHDDDDIAKDSDTDKETFEDDKITETTDSDIDIPKNNNIMDNDQTENTKITDIGHDMQSFNFATDSDQNIEGQNTAAETDTEVHDLTIDRCLEIEKESSKLESDVPELKKGIVEGNAEGKAENGAKATEGSSRFETWNLAVSIDDSTGKTSPQVPLNNIAISKDNIDLTCSDDANKARDSENQGYCLEEVSDENRDIPTNSEVDLKSYPEFTTVYHQDENEDGSDNLGSKLSDRQFNKNRGNVTGGIGEKEDGDSLVPVEKIPKVYSSVHRVDYEDLCGFRKGSENTEAKSKSLAELIPTSKAMPIRQCTDVTAQMAKEIKPSKLAPITSSQNQFLGHTFVPKSSTVFSKTEVKVLKSAKHPVQTKGHAKHTWFDTGVIDCIMKVGQKPQVKEIERLKQDPLNQPIRMRKFREQDRHGSIEELRWSRHMRAEIRHDTLRESNTKSKNKNGTGNNFLPRLASPLRCPSPTPGCSSTSSEIKKARIQSLRSRYELPVNPFPNRNHSPRSPEYEANPIKSRRNEINPCADTTKESKCKEALHSVMKQLLKSYKEAERRKASRNGTPSTDDTPTFGIRRHTSLMDLSDDSSDINC